MRARWAALPAADREAIRASALRDGFAGRHEAEDRLGWSFEDITRLLYVLSNSAEQDASPNSLGHGTLP